MPGLCALCREAGLFAARLVAPDGSKFRAAASPKRVIGRREIADEAARLDGTIAAYLAGLDEADAAEPDDAPEAVETALAALHARRRELDRMAARLDAQERNTLVEGEEDARPMGYAGGPKPPSYNVQAAVDADTGLIVHHEVTDAPTDRRQLHPMASATKESLGLDALTVVADKGFDNGEHAGACERDGIVAGVPSQRSITNQGDGALLDRTAFAYDPATDTLACPAARTLMRKQLHRRKRNVTYVSQDGSGCALKPACTTAGLHHRRTAHRQAPPRRRCAQPHGRPRHAADDESQAMCRRASLRHHQAHDGGRALPDQEPEGNQNRNGPFDPRL